MLCCLSLASSPAIFRIDTNHLIELCLVKDDDLLYEIRISMKEPQWLAPASCKSAPSTQTMQCIGHFPASHPDNNIHCYNQTISSGLKLLLVFLLHRSCAS
jgi:hypothetical protein